MNKRKDEHSSNQTMTSSSSFATLTKAKTAQLHSKGIQWKEIKNKNKTTPNDTLQKLILRQKSKANLH